MDISGSGRPQPFCIERDGLPGSQEYCMPQPCREAPADRWSRSKAFRSCHSIATRQRKFLRGLLCLVCEMFTCSDMGAEDFGVSS